MKLDYEKINMFETKELKVTGDFRWFADWSD